MKPVENSFCFFCYDFYYNLFSFLFYLFSFVFFFLSSFWNVFFLVFCSVIFFCTLLTNYICCFSFLYKNNTIHRWPLCGFPTNFGYLQAKLRYLTVEYLSSWFKLLQNFWKITCLSSNIQLNEDQWFATTGPVTTSTHWTFIKSSLNNQYLHPTVLFKLLKARHIFFVGVG